MTEAKPDEQAILEGWNLGLYKHRDPLGYMGPLYSDASLALRALFIGPQHASRRDPKPWNR